MEDVVSFRRRFRDANVWISGHTGFKGSWLTQWLLLCGARVHGYSLSGASPEDLFESLALADRIVHERGDIRDEAHVYQSICTCRPDFIFHLAAQPLVRQSYLKPAQTHCTNVMGTVNVLEAARSLDKHCTVVCISTDKCYENQGWCFGYRECDSLGGYDPYSASKAAMEIIVRSYQQSFLPNHGNIRVATARAGNVIGGGDWAEDRIVPDCARAFLFGATLKVRNPDATRPWQHVLDPLSGYMLLASALSTDGSLCTAFNFGPQQDGCRSVTVLVNEMKQHLGGRWELDDAVTQPHEAQALSLSIDKATRVLGWRPTWGFSKAVEKTAEWYRAAHSGADVRELTISHINAFELDMAE